MTEEAAHQVRRRRVFYIPGYDPFHPRRYRELYRKEGATQAAPSIVAITCQPYGPPAFFADKAML